MLHAIIRELSVSILGTIVAIKMDLSPAWYPIALVVMSLPCAWVGGKLASRR